MIEGSKFDQYSQSACHRDIRAKPPLLTPSIERALGGTISRQLRSNFYWMAVIDERWL